MQTYIQMARLLLAKFPTAQYSFGAAFVWWKYIKTADSYVKVQTKKYYNLNKMKLVIVSMTQMSYLSIISLKPFLMRLW